MTSENSSIEPRLEQSFQHLEDYFNSLLNTLFSTSPRAGNLRYLVTRLLFIFIWILLSFTLHQPGEINYPWLDFLYAIPYPFFGTLIAIIEMFFAWDVVLLMIAIYLGYTLAAQIASIYLADIFELKDITIASRYISQTAFSFPGFSQINIENAQVRPSDQSSPIVKIGGPGKVTVNLENAVVFEKISGKPRVVGPTIDKPVTLENFERIRKIIDLRDQSAVLTIRARTLDGIPIEVRDIRILFSVFRNAAKSSISKPYPFNEESIYWLVYQTGSAPWTTSLVELVRTELTSYINHHYLSELLSSVGAPEIQQQLANQKRILQKIRSNWSHTRRYKVQRILTGKLKKDSPAHKPIYYKKVHQKSPRASLIPGHKTETLVAVIPRTSLSNIFYENLTSSFQSRIQKFGMKLEWINVGTLQTPNNIVSDQYLKSWKISSENMLRGNKKILDGVLNQSRLHSLSKTIQNLPILSFIEKHEQGKGNKVIIDELISEYNAKLISARELYLSKKGRVPIQIDRAIQIIRNYQKKEIKNHSFFIGESNQE